MMLRITGGRMHYRSDVNINFIVFSEDNLLRFALNSLLSEMRSIPAYRGVNFIFIEVMKLNDVFTSLLKNKCSSLIIFDFDFVFFSEKIKIIERIARLHRPVKTMAICSHWDYNHHAYFYNSFCDIVLKRNDALEIYSSIINHELNILLTKEFNVSHRGKEKNIFHHFSLSTRESEILKLIMKGKNNSEIAGQLFISVKTVSTHRSNIYSKFNARTISELYRVLIRENLIEKVIPE
ncbi:hypothetical protein C3432_22015 [Citrobacter amalonaticus]|uniref:HTH luxR-type domain-containing protein n=1 Tax=Citrobacter amalonaticus TaxID=35703 RepID=A0A2S4RS59_CITAM|nr:LuxR C-terminal-related transcriptional regulator [Citrobacter amalonaticus]POT55708.1 hypothetical protein C3432_22015 [Citrobacter amalonaticus]POT73921.1 hypothetical protein C3436_19480 [Citrobacter amalonaticus]POU62306.1 hypothetical protein C3430_23355 [Citrobacter amalonaticus]POV02808.1 hypothetical protein C3424_24950 [Citrobacter amalonaticus]